jgi:hypothetical protein
MSLKVFDVEDMCRTLLYRYTYEKFPDLHQGTILATLRQSLPVPLR